MATKKERKGSARARREAERARKARQARIRRWGLVLAVVLIAGVVVVVIARGGSQNKATAASVQQLLAKYPDQAKAAGCGEVKDVGAYNPSSQDHAHIGQDVSTPPPLTSYPSVPPASGPHDANPQGAGVYTQPPDIYKTIHSLEHGAVVIFYAPSVPASSLSQDEDFVRQNQDHVLMAPYSYPGNGSASSLPSGQEIALVAWHKVQTCTGVPGTAVLANFMSKYRNPTLGGGPFQGADIEKAPGGGPVPI